MKVDLKKVFPLESDKSDAWNQLRDVEKVASCMPGAEITERVADDHFKGKVKVKVGPVSLAFNGDIHVKNIDEEKQELHLVAEGKDKKGSSTASMDLTAFIRDGETSKVDLVGDAAVSLNGKLVSFGGRMIENVADQILDQFADNFRDLLPEASADTGDVSDHSSSEGSVGSANEASTASTPTPKKSNEINALSLMWNMLIGFFKNLFSGRK